MGCKMFAWKLFTDIATRAALFCSRAEPRASTARASCVLAALSLASCEWVMGGIPPKAEPDASDDGAEGPADDLDGAVRGDRSDGGVDLGAGASGERDAGAAEPHGGGPVGLTGGGSDAAPDGGGDTPIANDAAINHPGDAGTVGVDGGTPPASDAGGANSDAGGGHPAQDAATSCAQPGSWYADDDRDGYGRASAKVSACSAPGEAWSQRAGDCNDDIADVHPEQSTFFDHAYQAADGSMSFDYDCSGHEEGNNQQQAAPDDCGILALLNCTGSGYSKVARAGADNPLCGSRRKDFCQGALLGAVGCETSSEDVAEPYWCH
jgi:hypothetical protein